MGFEVKSLGSKTGFLTNQLIILKPQFLHVKETVAVKALMTN